MARLIAFTAGSPVNIKSGQHSTPILIGAWVLTGAALLFILKFHLLPSLLAALLVFELVHTIAPRLQGVFRGRRARLVAVALLATAIVAAVTAAILGIVALLRGGGTLTALLQKMADIIEGARSTVPLWLLDYLPADVDALRTALSEGLRRYAPELRLMGAETGRAFAHVLIGMIVGAMASLHEAAGHGARQPLAEALAERAQRVGDAFRRVVFAQVRISLLNTAFTAIYLLAILPLFGVHLPFTKTLIVVTFVAGLLPVIGNLISNTVIVVVSLAYSVGVAGASLAFLIVIHKLEYFLNARIVGSHIHAHAWELLIAMLAMEAAFGLPGLVAAPIYYAYLKRELMDRGLV
jgi:predicted PurR-regulated permease PerM